MSSMTLFYIAMLVFGLMITGLFFSARELLQASDNPAQSKSGDSDRD